MTSDENKLDFPRLGSAEYNLLFGDADSQKKTLKKWKRLNKYFTIPLYRAYILPLIGGGKIFLLLYTTGRKTGKRRITPIEYRTRDGEIHFVAGRGRKAHWLQNMLAKPDDVKVKVGFRKYPIDFELLSTIEEKNDLLTWYVTKYPKAAKMLFGWDPKKDDPTTADFTSFSKLIEIVKIAPK
jgi:deazaflavin-dependent oxidoreductase (nitroreductase family)